MEAHKKETIDCTPTWESLLPLMLHIIKTGKDKKNILGIEKEFLRMAKAADAYNKLINSDTLNEPK